MVEKKLEVKDLRISFWTTNGKVQAVRDISFDLYKGETLAIVGESGSGKSVTSRAIMGILAGNAIKEGGKILYGDKDLMKITEEEFHRIRGDKIAMVFQDPLSSLNPIMRVGAQLTEAMLLKNKNNRKVSKKTLAATLSKLEENMKAAGVENASEKLEKFKKFSLKQSELDRAYTAAHAEAEETAALADNLALRIQNKSYRLVREDMKELLRSAKACGNHFVVREKLSELTEAIDSLKSFTNKKEDALADAVAPLEKIRDIAQEALSFPAPDNFSLGYYLTFVNSEIPELPVDELNQTTGQQLNSEFLDSFMDDISKAVAYSANATDKKRQEAVKILKEELPGLAAADVTEQHAVNAAKTMKAAVEKCVDPLEVIKDSLTHTFGSSIDYANKLFFTGEKRNKKEERRYNREQARFDRIVARGKTPKSSVIPASYINLEAAHQDIVDTVNEMAEHLEATVESDATLDTRKRAGDIVENLKELAQNSVNNLTRSMAKEKAVKLMESVGIDEPRRRYRQYPFEFSGGMRQRIVIAIALTADPDILICDEPTTALDVTIQAQILELINELKKQRNLSVIFITHDLGVVANMADRIAVMYAGRICEYGTARDVFYSPAHPYTWALLSSVPDLNTKGKLESIPGTPPNMIYPPKGDAFADRNKYAMAIDFEEQPPMFKVSDTHYAATWLLHPDAPKIELPEVLKERIEKKQKEASAE